MVADLERVFDGIETLAYDPNSNRESRMALGKDAITGGSGSGPPTHVIRTNTYPISKAPEDLKALSEKIHSLQDDLIALGFTVSGVSKTLDALPEPQYFEATIERRGLSGMILVTVSPPLNGHITYTAVAYFN